VTLAGSRRLTQQLQFVTEMDRLKQVLRQTRLMDASRRENSAEHSWHVALMAVVLLEYAPQGTDITRVLEMLLLHDVVEIGAGDTFCYDIQANLDKATREQAAAEQIFGLLPDDSGIRLRELWEEFELGTTNEARFANALDRLQPLLHNVHAQGGTWRAHGISRDQVLERMRPIEHGAPQLWPYVLDLISQACEQGFIAT
jgi:putative hydrolases of HD superfamily